MFIEVSEGRWLNKNDIKEIIYREISMYGAGGTWRVSIRVGNYVEDLLESSDKKKTDEVFNGLMAKLMPDTFAAKTPKTKSKAGK